MQTYTKKHMYIQDGIPKSRYTFESMKFIITGDTGTHIQCNKM